MKTLTETAVDPRKKNFLTESEAEAFIKAAKMGRNGERNYAMALLAYRHGLRVSELIGIRMSDLDLSASRLYVRRAKGSLSTTQPMYPDEVRAVKAWLRRRAASQWANSPLLFVGSRGPFTRQAVNYLFSQIALRAGLGFHVHPHMFRHACGWALANRCLDTRLIQDYLGHRDIRYTTLYTRTSVRRFEGLWG